MATPAILTDDDIDHAAPPQAPQALTDQDIDKISGPVKSAVNPAALSDADIDKISAPAKAPVDPSLNDPKMVVTPLKSTRQIEYEKYGAELEKNPIDTSVPPSDDTPIAQPAETPAPKPGYQDKDLRNLLAEDAANNPIRSVKPGNSMAEVVAKAGERYPAGFMKTAEDLQTGKQPLNLGAIPDLVKNIYTPNPDKRSATDIALDMGSRVLPKAEIKNPNDQLEYLQTVGKEFIKNLPFATAGAVSELGNPTNSLIQGAAAKLPNINVPAPQWIDNAITGFINNFGSPFSALNEAAKTKLTNSITDEIFDKVKPRMDELKDNFKAAYGREATDEDIKGAIRTRLDGQGLQGKNVAQLATHLFDLKTQPAMTPVLKEPAALPGAQEPVNPAEGSKPPETPKGPVNPPIVENPPVEMPNTPNVGEAPSVLNKPLPSIGILAIKGAVPDHLKDVVANAPAIDDTLRAKLNEMKEMLYMGEAPQKLGATDQQNKVWGPSSNPDFFQQQKDWTKSETINIINKVAQGKPVTALQWSKLNTMLNIYDKSPVKGFSNENLQSLPQQTASILASKDLTQPEIEQVVQYANESGTGGQDTPTGFEPGATARESATVPNSAEYTKLIDSIHERGGRVLRTNSDELTGEHTIEYEVPQKAPAAEITPSGQLRHELQAPIPGSLFQDKGELFDGNQIQEAPAAYGEHAPVFYSKLANIVKEKMSNSATPEQVRGMLSPANGVKPEEYNWLGIDDFLAGKTKVTKQELQDHIDQNQVQVNEVEKNNLLVDQKLKKLQENLDASQSSYTYVRSQLNGKEPYLSGYPATWMFKNSSGIPTKVPEDFHPAIDKYYEAQNALENYKDSLGEDYNPPKELGTKYHGYQLPGGANYRELLLTLPSKPDISFEKWNENRASWDKPPGTREEYLKNPPTVNTFKSQHFDEQNILAHVRMNDRTDSEGNKVLFIEEVQSDWHQKGRSLGYRGTTKLSPEEISQRILQIEGKEINATPEEKQEWASLKSIQDRKGVPDAPFKKSWQELAMKRMLRYAAENGYDKLAWTTGEQQAERYDLSKQIDNLGWAKKENGNYYIVAFKDGKQLMIEKDLNVQKLEDTIGKDLALKIINSPDKDGSIKGDGLKIGGEGMKGFYDQILPSFMNKYAKKWGGKVGESSISHPEEYPGHSWQGPDYSLDQLEDGLKVAQSYGPDKFESPFTGEKQQFAVNRVANANPLRDIVKAMKSGDSFKEAMNIHGGGGLADLLGGKFVANPIKSINHKVHSIDITPSMRESVLSQGQSIFENSKKYGTLKNELETSYGSKEKENAAIKRALSEAANAGTAQAGGSATALPKFAKDFQKKGHINIVGQKVKTSQDAAELASLFRSPYIENFQTIFIKSGKVVAHQVITTGQSNSVNFNSMERFKYDIVDAARRLGVNQVYIAHNHPSGNSAPSQPDIDFTQHIGSALQSKKIKLLGHIVTNGETYSFINADTLDNRDQLYLTDKFKSPKENYVRAGDAKPISNIQQAALEAKKIYQPGKTAVLFLDSQNRVLSADHVGNDKNVVAFTNQMLDAYKASRAIIVRDEGLSKDFKGISDKVLDIIEVGQKSLKSLDRTGVPTSNEARVRIREDEPNYSGVKIPEFKSTEEALKFGADNKDNPAVLDQLKQLREESVNKNKALMAKDNLSDQEMQQAMDEAVRGQFFREALEASTGKGKAINKLTGESGQAFINPAIDAVAQAAKEIINILAPKAFVPRASLDNLMKMKGERDQSEFELEVKMNKLEKAFDKMPQADQVAFIDNIKTGTPQATQALQKVADMMRTIEDQYHAEAKQYKPSLAYKENHFRVPWKVIPGSTSSSTSRGFSGSSNLEGSKGFMKQATLKNISDGLAMGGVPYSFNPVTMWKMAIMDMQKYITAQRMWEAMKKMGTAIYVPLGKSPLPGFSRLDDRLATVYFPTPPGLVHAGNWFVEDQVGRVLNNFLSRDAIREKMIGKGLLAFKNITTSIELSLSPFHASYVSLTAMSSAIGLGLQKIYNVGLLKQDPKAFLDGLTSITSGMTGLAPIDYALTGAKMIRMISEPNFLNSKAGQDFIKTFPDAKQLLSDLFLGGGKLAMHQDYKIDSIKAFKQGITNKEPWAVFMSTLPAGSEFIMKPLFEVYIPRLKIGAFLKEYSTELVAREDELTNGRLTRAKLARDVWSSVENRFGEMNFDNLFWNRTFKTSMQLLFRSVTWKMGALQNIFGAGTGQLKDLVTAVQDRKAPLLNRNLSWLLGLCMMVVAFSEVTQRALIGKDIESWKDILDPRYDKEGNRIFLNTHLKDWAHLIHSPGGFISNSLAGYLERIHEAWTNKDFFNTEIHHPGDPVPQQAWDILRHLVPTPFSLSGQGQLKNEDAPTAMKVTTAMGLTTPAPGYVNKTSALEKAQELRGNMMPAGTRTKEAFQKSQDIHKLEQEYDKTRNFKPLEAALTSGKITDKQYKQILDNADKTPLQKAVHGLSYQQVAEVMEKADKSELKELLPIFTAKIDRKLDHALTGPRNAYMDLREFKQKTLARFK